MELIHVRRRTGPRRQRGAAILIAMIIVTLVSTMAASMVWQQWRSVQIEIAERARSQSTWILAGALDWARLILREDSNSSPNIDHLGEPWAVPLAEARLTTFLAAENSSSDDSDGPEAFLSGAITDANARYNLTNIAPGGVLNPVEAATFVRICDAAGVSADVAQLITTKLLEAEVAAAPVPPSGASRSATAPLLPESVLQLRWMGVDAHTLQLLDPYVVILPTASKLNVNTASKEVLAVVIKDLDLGTAARIVEQRASKPYHSTGELTLSPDQKKLAPTQLDVKSAYFEVSGRLRLGDKVLEERSLVARRNQNDIVTIQRRRLSSVEATP